MLKVKSLWFASIAAVLLAGCSSTPPITKTEKKDEKPKVEKPPAKNVTPAPESPEIIAGVSSLFKSKCSSCHGVESRGSLGDIMDVTELRNRNLIGEDAESSVLFTIINSKHQDGEFDPRTRKRVELPTDPEINFVRLWLDAGAPDLRSDRDRIGLDEYLQRLRLDASSVLRASQNELVYIDFHGVYNSERFNNAELQAFANATLKLLNHLDVESTSTNRNDAVVIKNPENNLPIAVRFDPQRFNLDKIEDIERFIIRPNDRQDINDLFACDIPAIPVLDFLGKAAADDIFNVFGNGGLGTFESAYSNIVWRKLLIKAGFLNEDQLVFDPISEADFIANGFTNISNINQLQILEALDPNNFDRASIDVLYNAGNDRERVVRGALLNSGVSAANRVIDRLSQSDGGFTYVSWDVLSFNNVNQNKDFFEANFVGPANPANDPIVRPANGFQPFEVDGGEGIHQLPNRMLAFTVYNANLQLVTSPPTDAVLNGDNLERGNRINTHACHSCHQAFTIPFTDALLPTVIETLDGREFAEAGFGFKFSQTQNDWDFTFSNDAAAFTDELRNVYFSRSESGDLADGVWSLGKLYINDLTNEDIVADLGIINIDFLKDAIKDNTDLVADLASTFGGGSARENYVANYQVFVEQIGTSNEDFLRGCIEREASDVGDFGDQDDGSQNGSNDGEEGNVGN